MKEDEVGAKIQFVLVGQNKDRQSIYKKATEEEIKNDDITKVTNIVAKNGVVVAKGLDDGKYKIVEEKAPAGYSVVTVNDVTIENGGNPTATVNVSDTNYILFHIQVAWNIPLHYHRCCSYGWRCWCFLHQPQKRI